MDRPCHPLRVAKPEDLLATPLRCHTSKGVAMEVARDDVAVQPSLLDESKKLRKASQALRAMSRELCRLSKATRERSAAIHEHCRVTLRE